MKTKELVETAKELSSQSSEVSGVLVKFANQLTEVTTYLTHQVMEKAPQAFDLLCSAMRLSAAVQIVQAFMGCVIIYICYKIACKCHQKSSMNNGWFIGTCTAGIIGSTAGLHIAEKLFNPDIFITLISPQAELALLALRKAGLGMF